MDEAVQPSATPQTPPTPQEQESPSSSYGGYGKKKWIKWGLIYAVIAAVLYGGIYVFFQAKKITNPYSTTSTSPTPQPTTAIDETANWKTYTSSNGYSIKYPSNAMLNTTTSNDSIEFEIKNDMADITFWKPITLLQSQTIDSFLNPPGLGSAPDMKKVQVSMLGGASVYRYEGTSNNQPFIHIGVPLNGNKVLEIRAEGNQDIDELKINVDQILSTFKFTDQNQTIDTSNWKTYTNDNLKIQFKYPSVYDISEETSSSVSLGIKAENGYITYLTITKDPQKFTNYESMKLCPQAAENEHCIATEGWQQKKPISNIQLDGVDAVSFYLAGGVDFAFRIVQTTSQPKIELKMDVAGGGLDRDFNQILSTFKFSQ